MTHIITTLCQTCRDGACLSQCPVDCIHEGTDQYHIDPDGCIDCGACVWVCPVEAIFPESEAPAPLLSPLADAR